jgi:cytochrome c peroxidase
LLSAVLISALLLPGGAAWAAGGDPLPLSAVPVPEPPNLATYVKDKAAAVKLGKALFWDTQAGSDGVTACATCHYRAGADPISVRSKNQLNPGHNAAFDVAAGPNSILTLLQFPFFQVNPVDAQLQNDGTFIVNGNTGSVTNNKDDVAGSQGVRLAQFVGISGSPVDNSSALNDLTFFISGPINVRQVTGRNTPPAVNAVFNYANFWDGRANNIFNGSSPIGPLDQSAGIWIESGGVLSKQTISILNASLASQAVGPPLSDVEMSYRGRTFPELGRKLLSLTPLGQQTVHPADSELGSLSRAVLNPDGTLSGSKGLNATYAQMIKDAFVSSLTSTTLTTNIVTRGASVSFNQMEANFSLFWGLAIQLYEATLVSDQTPFDQYLDDLSKGVISTVLSADAQTGFNTFQSKCAKCHSGSELTAASVSNVVTAITNTGTLIEKGVTSVSESLGDIGFNNIGVRPTADDIGRGAKLPSFPYPLSFAAQAISKETDSSSIPFATFPLPGGASASSPLAVDGAFKIPSLRNVELTPPYMHNGSMFTLAEVVEFYSRGGNFANPELAKLMSMPAGISLADRNALVEFLKALTDPRVALESAPFDHPELLLPQGDPELPMTRLLATGSNGEADVLSAFTINVTSPTNQTSQTIGGTLEQVGADVMAAPMVSVNGGAPASATRSGSTWSFNVTGLVQGDNSISATATDLTGVTKTITKTVLAGITAPVGSIVINNDDAVTSSPNVTLSLSAAGPSAVTSMRFSTDGLYFTPYEQFASTRAISLPSGDGDKIIYVRFRDSANRESTVYSDTIVLDSTVQPVLVLTINVKTPTNVNYQIVSGTVEAGSTVKVTVDTPARVGPVTVTGASWSALVSGLSEGPNTVTVHATDSKGVVILASAVIIVDTKDPFVNIDTAIGVCIRAGSIGIAGTAEIGSQIKVICDHAKADVIFFDDALIDKTRWTAMILGFVEGLNHCEVIAIDAAGNKAVEKVDLDHDNIKPNIHIDANVKKVAKFGALEAITGTVDAGITPTMTLNGAAYSAPVTTNGSAWSCTVDDFKLGDNIIRVEARDLCENVNFEDFHIFVIKADGELDGHVGVTVGDALKALRFSVGLDNPKIEDVFHADFLGDNFIDIADAIFILKKAVDENLNFEELIAEILAVQAP